MKKRQTIFIMILAISLLIPGLAKADMGPKPSTTLNIKGMGENEIYYVTLLSPDQWGPWSRGHMSYDPEDPEERDLAKTEAFLINEFEDPDGYHYIGNLEELQGKASYIWSYYPPSDFKIFIYFPQRDQAFISQPLQSFAFHSIFNVDLKIYDTV